MDISVLEGRHVLMTLMYISDNEGCTKTQLYAAVSRNGNMPRKLDELESAGLIEQTGYRDSGTVRLSLTDLGRRVSGKLSEISGWSEWKPSAGQPAANPLPPLLRIAHRPVPCRTVTRPPPCPSPSSRGPRAWNRDAHVPDPRHILFRMDFREYNNQQVFRDTVGFISDDWEITV